MDEKLPTPKIAKIIDQSAGILLIENNIPLRTLYSNALKALGYQTIFTVNEISIAIGILESESIDWVICGPQVEGKNNIYHLLNMCCKYEALKDILVTVPISEAEKKHIPHLSSLGCFSWFVTKFTEDHIRTCIEDLTKTIKEKNLDPILTTLHYLEIYLKEKQSYTELIKIYKNIIKLYPGQTSILYKLAEAQLLAGQKKEGTLTLQQASTLDPDSRKTAQAIADQYLSGVLPSIAAKSTDQNPFGLKECVICKVDGNSKKIIEALLTETLVPYKFFAEADKCLDYCKQSQNTSVLISGWWDEDFSAAAFLQRFRSTCPDALISMVAHKLDSAEAALLNELNCATVLKPPLMREKFLESLIWTIQQDRRPLEKSFLIIKIRQSLESGEIDQAIKYKEDLEGNPLASRGDVQLCTSEILLRQGKYEGSLSLAIDALKYGGDAVASLNAMGRSFMKLGKFDKAFQAFDQAQELSPLNVKRLCHMAEMQFELGQDISETLEEARTIDESNRQIMATEAKTEIAQGHVHQGKNLLAEMNSIKDVIAYLNNKAVSTALEKKYDEAISLYEQAAEAVPDLHAKYRTIVNFNLGILYLRTNDMDNAEKVLRLCLPEEDAEVTQKASQIIENIEQARASHQQLKMAEKEPPPPFQLDEDNLRKIKKGIRLAKVDNVINKGDRCLFQIHHCTEKLQICTESLSHLPPFKAKQSVELEDKKMFL